MNDPDTPQRVPIKEHFEALLLEMDKRYNQRFDAQEKAVTSALTAAKEAVGKAETAAEKRFDSVNEFRGQQSDIVATFMPRKEHESEMRTAMGKIDDLQRRLDRNEGRSTGLGQGWGYVVGAAGLVAALVAIFVGINSKVERNTGRLEQAIPVPVTAPAPLPVKQTP